MRRLRSCNFRHRPIGPWRVSSWWWVWGDGGPEGSLELLNAVGELVHDIGRRPAGLCQLWTILITIVATCSGFVASPLIRILVRDPLKRTGQALRAAPVAWITGRGDDTLDLQLTSTTFSRRETHGLLTLRLKHTSQARRRGISQC
jgi:hypothetical protein